MKMYLNERAVSHAQKAAELGKFVLVVLSLELKLEESLQKSTEVRHVSGLPLYGGLEVRLLHEAGK